MIVYPAVDIRGGRVVRLRYGDPEQETVHGDNPIAVARRWVEAGAPWLHVVNLDGALGEAGTTLNLLPEIARLGVPVQFGGGLRSLEDITAAIGAGVTRVVLGTLALRDHTAAAQAIKRFGAEAVAVALDAKEGRVTTHGWQQRTLLTPIEAGRIFEEMGYRHALYTDISRDGALTGVNVQATAALQQETGLTVIASGGVASLDDLRSLKAVGIAGVVIGKALYTDQFTLQEALEVADG